MSALHAYTSMQTVSPRIDSSVNNVLLQTNPNFNQSLLEFIHILERRLIDPLLHDPPGLGPSPERSGPIHSTNQWSNILSARGMALIGTRSLYVMRAFF